MLTDENHICARCGDHRVKCNLCDDLEPIVVPLKTGRPVNIATWGDYYEELFKEKE